MRAGSRDLGFHAAHQKMRGIPAADETQAVRAERRLQRVARVGHLVPLLDAVEADRGGLFEACFERDRGAEGPIVVIRPGDGVGSIKDHACRSVR